MDGVRDGKPPGARGGVQILGIVRGKWLRLAPQAYGGRAGCWVVAGTWPHPGGSCSAFSSAPRLWQSFIRVSLQRLVGGAVLGQRCARFSLCNDRCPVVRTFLLCAEAVPHGPALLFHGAVFGQSCCWCPLLVNDRCPCSAVAVLHGSLTRLFFAAADPHGPCP